MTNNHFIELPHSINLRTLAGYQTKDGRFIKPNKILRSGALDQLTVEDSQRLADDYGVGLVIDLRTDEEARRHPDCLPPDARYYQLPVMPFSDHASFSQRLKRHFTKSEDPVVHMYKKMLTDSHAKSAYQDMFTLLLNHTDDDQSVLIHCTAGKDRTGVAAMLVEAALGVPEETIQADYLLSNVSLECSKIQLAVTRSNQSDQVETMGSLPVNRANLQAVFRLIAHDYESWADYLETELNVSQDNLATMQRAYLI
ncbi:tyrosine-protein phosphatase [Lacticaseibacillus hegangensis]|uniref:Tyrosine-protein phosphatase n=1 Tax=Lacticaseibacillus hegangensis TaxID=2486010 RepID=A0ABW4CW92_9LACO|nr:tyrosine-protein phosphatase [Lacticaseibacillus hegangensis]